MQIAFTPDTEEYKKQNNMARTNIGMVSTVEDSKMHHRHHTSYECS